MNKLLFVVGAVLVGLVATALVLPDRVVVERSISISRPATTVFTLLDGFTSWTEWSPWVARDASVTVTRSGPERGPGARIDWSGDPSKAGLGSQEVIGSDPVTRIDQHEGPAQRGAPGKILFQQSLPFLDDRQRCIGIAIAGQVNEIVCLAGGEVVDLLRAAWCVGGVREALASGDRVDKGRLADVGASGKADFHAVGRGHAPHSDLISNTICC